ncbi:MAG: hypothetical protein ACLPQY_27130 [Streptosporangiaceae bacterium]
MDHVHPESELPRGVDKSPEQPEAIRVARREPLGVRRGNRPRPRSPWELEDARRETVPAAERAPVVPRTVDVHDAGGRL